ncbi:succinate dehydrogenase assembly factor 2 [Rhodobacteraceae bacterium]|nr:succinate dehydrogenase assembly factor 2 [Paracoccaceae bacterium]
MTEDRATRLKRLNMRSMRRGIKEMDLILSSFWADHGASLNADDLDLYEAMLSENDQDLYKWVSGQQDPPSRFAPLISRLKK